MKDKLYSDPQKNIEDFVFNEAVSNVFDDMVDRSVPGYRTLIANLGPIAAKFIKENTNCYDLGCSHGAAALSVFNHLPHKNVTIHAVDSAKAMIDRCDQLINQAHADSIIHTHQANIQDITILNASIVLLNLTLQFIPLDQRSIVLANIYNGLIKGGVCIMTEKIMMPDEYSESLFQELHTNFKSANKYSDLEISQKRKSLENVLICETLDIHSIRLRSVGFSTIIPWFQCFNFISLLAIK
ncbi:MAG: carboxy-S-adenosyl-L-methionine synthase CmoA [Pseudomonadota bacterium]